MNMKKLAKQLKTVLIGLIISSLIVFFGIIPMMGKEIIYAYPEFDNWFWPWMIFVLICAVPWYITLVYGWKIALNVGRNKAFSIMNASLLKKMEHFSYTDAFVFLTGNIVLWLMNMNHPGVLLTSLLVVFIFIGSAVIEGVLSDFVVKAARIQEENDLTI